MDALKLGAGFLAVLGLASCSTLVAPPATRDQTQEPAPVAEVAAPGPDLPRQPGVAVATPGADAATAPWLAVSALDLDGWPFGWVTDESTRTLGLPDRFWSDQKPRWREALDPRTSPAVAAQRLEAVNRSGTADEALRSAWHLFLIYSQAGIGDRARGWLDRVEALKPWPSVEVERAWDQAFRMNDVAGARALWPGHQSWADAEVAQRARLLRQKLFGGIRSLREVGADDYVSTQVLDNDDLWAATWDGAVVRWSLATDQLDLMLGAGATVSPMKLLVATGWFLYAFQDRSLLRYSKVTGTWRSFSYPPGWTGLRVQAAVATGEETLWVANLGQGLWRWDRGQWTLVDDGGGGPFLNALASNGHDGFLIGTKDRGLWSWDQGIWTAVHPESGADPVNVSVIEPDATADRWLVGTWGEGTWVLSAGRLSRWSADPDYVTSAVWQDGAPLWGALDVGLVRGQGGERQVLGVREGLPTTGVSGLVSWEGRWIWGSEQGWGWWSEHENPALLR